MLDRGSEARMTSLAVDMYLELAWTKDFIPFASHRDLHSAPTGIGASKENGSPCGTQDKSRSIWSHSKIQALSLIPSLGIGHEPYPVINVAIAT